MSKQKDRGKEEPMTMEHYQEEKENRIEGRNAVLEAIRADRTIERLYVQDGCKDGPVQTILREAKKRGIQVQFVDKARLSRLSQTGKHQGGDRGRGSLCLCPGGRYAGPGKREGGRSLPDPSGQY